MGYRRAEEILPVEIIKLIQQYVDGEHIYIPKKEGNRRPWGEGTRIRKELKERNSLIFHDHQNGLGISELAEKYWLSEKSIQRIIREIKKQCNYEK